MEDESAPLDDLLKTLEVSLTTLLQKVRPDPWSLLIFQTLLWSFRRWAIHYLLSSDTVGSMHNYVWDSHIDLVRQHAPQGLQEFGIVWLSPSNVGDRSDSLEELNSYFMFIVDKLNNSIETDNEDEQNSLSIFLDETITDIMDEWLEDLHEYRIYPGHGDSSDNFSTEKIFTIMQKIMEKGVSKKTAIVLPPSPLSPPSEILELHVPSPVEPFVPSPVEPFVPSPPDLPIDSGLRCICPYCSTTLIPVCIGATVLCPCGKLLQASNPISLESSPVPETIIPVPETIIPVPETIIPVPETIASALQRRRTMKNRANKTSNSATRNRRKFPTPL